MFVLNWKKIYEYIKNIPFEVINPYNKAVNVELVTALPKILRDQKLWLLFTNAGGNKFELGPRETRTAILSMVKQPRIISRRPWVPIVQPIKPGIIQPDDMLDDVSGDQAEIMRKPELVRVITLIDGQNMGRMTYQLQSEPGVIIRDERPIGLEEEVESGDEGTYVGSVIESLLQQDGVKGVTLCKINLDIEFEE